MRPSAEDLAGAVAAQAAAPGRAGGATPGTPCYGVAPWVLGVMAGLLGGGVAQVVVGGGEVGWVWVLVVPPLYGVVV